MKPILITCQPDDEYFIWQNHLYIESCIEAGFEEENIHILLYKPAGRIHNENWKKLKEFYPKLNIFLYEDKGVQRHLGIYIPILRPHILWQHFEAFPELEDRTVIYTDCDILWTKNPELDKYYNGDVSYVSNASSYLNNSYFESKVKDVLPEKLEQYKERDVVKELCTIVGIDKQTVLDNNFNTGGVQYILKNVNVDFWKKVEKDVLLIRTHLLAFNKEFFKDENSGIQSWCADLWAVQYNLWLYGETRVINELDFAWSTDPIQRIDSHNILHNAGITGTFMNDVPMFYKGKYHQGTSPFIDDHLQNVIDNEQSKKTCNWYYANKLLELKNKYYNNNN
jgi:hypothetical protein